MFINAYGNRNDPLVVLLAPMMVSGEDVYQLTGPYFKHSYHFIAPDQGGHGKAGAYISADEEYKTLKSFLLDAGYTELVIRPSFRHCGYMAAHMKEYTEEMESFIRRKKDVLGQSCSSI